MINVYYRKSRLDKNRKVTNSLYAFSRHNRKALLLS